MTTAVMEKGKTMNDYIKREDAERLLRYYFLSALTEDERVDELNRIPSADVIKVVRCKECKYLKPFTSQYGAGQYCECPCSFGGQGIKKPDDYCSYGERRDDKEYRDSIINARKGEE